MVMQLAQQTRCGRRYDEDTPDENGRIGHYISCTLGPQHYESEIDSGVFDATIDVNLQRTNNAKLNGFRITNNGWHFAIQTQDATRQQAPRGTVAFGGRQGAHWLTFRLERAGYLHWPSRTLQGIGGAADYSATPTASTLTRNLVNHPSLPDEIQNYSTSAEWRNLWTTPGGGEVYVRWVVKGSKLKEEIVINQAAREWIAANMPPSTPANETWFGFRFDFDTVGIPRCVCRGILRDINEDFEDEADGVTFEDATKRLLAFLPADFVYAKGRGGRRRLRKRFFRENGKNYLYVGVKVSELAGLLPGDLVFDPSFSQEAIQATADDCYENAGTNDTTPPYGNEILIGSYGGYDLQGGWRFTPNVPADASFTGGGSEYASLRLYQGGDYSLTGTPSVTFYVDVTDGAAPAWQDGTGAERPSGTGTTNSLATTNFAPTTAVGSNNQWNGANGLDVAAHMEEAVAVTGWAANNGMRFYTQNNGSTGTEYFSVADFDDANTEARLDGFYTTAGGAPVRTNLLTLLGVG